jgi:uncharacterized protein DUF3455
MRAIFTKNTTQERQTRAIHAATLKILLAGIGMLAGIAPASALSQESQIPPAIAPPPGNILFLKAHGTGTQNYICQPSATGDGTAWVFFSPQATLSISLLGQFNQQVATHFLSPVPNTNTALPEPSCTLSSATGQVSCPTWQSSLDSSTVWGGKVSSIDAGTDAVCSHTGAIPCLLLNAVATDGGQQGENGLLSKTTFIQRLNTEGGSAPAGSCKLGDQALVPYSADYLFYTAAHDQFYKH